MYVILNYRTERIPPDIATLAGHGQADRGTGVRNQAARRDFYLS